MNQGEDGQITLEDLLHDAAVALEKEAGFSALARAVRMAMAERGAIPDGERWVEDIVRALEAAEQVVVTARTEARVNLEPLDEALGVVAQWGLSPDHRMGNFIRHTIVRLENMRSLTSSTIKEREHAGLNADFETLIFDAVEELLSDFGVPRYEEI